MFWKEEELEIEKLVWSLPLGAKGRLRFGKWLAKAYLEEKNGSQWW